MKTIDQIKIEKQEKVSQLIKDCSVFFAFSDEQFLENKTPLAEGEKYVSMGAGGYAPKSKAAQFHTGLAEIEDWYKSELKTTKSLRRASIAYELANHEAYYTGSITDTLNALGEGYTAKEVWKVYHEESTKQEAA